MVGFDAPLGAMTRTWKIYFSISQLIPDGQYTKIRGANYLETYYWSDLGEEIYDIWVIRYFSERAILAVNVYYFFIRRNCLFQSLKNIPKFTFDAKMTARG